jgi:hypothetical protein
LSYSCFYPVAAWQCAITIPTDVGMSRVDGFYVVDEYTHPDDSIAAKAYIVDSQVLQ